MQIAFLRDALAIGTCQGRHSDYDTCARTLGAGAVKGSKNVRRAVRHTTVPATAVLLAFRRRTAFRTANSSPPCVRDPLRPVAITPMARSKPSDDRDSRRVPR